MTRRRFLELATATAAASPFVATGRETNNQLEAEEANASTAVNENSPHLRLLLHEPNGAPLSHERAMTLIARDLANDPLPQPISIAEGRARVGLAKGPLQAAVRLNVPGFGEVYCYADDEGRGYSRQTTIEFAVEAARTRLRRVRELAEACRHEGVAQGPEIKQHLDRAGAPLPKKSGPEQIGAAYQSLAHGLHAGEKLALSRARNRIAKLTKPRTEFLFGGLAAGWQKGPEFQKAFTGLFNYGVMSWYTWKPAHQTTGPDVDYGRMDASLDWCVANKMVPKGFGYVYLARGATPEWLRRWSFEQVLPECKMIVSETARRYAGRVPYMEIMNEAHDKANIFGLTHAQVLELAREACRAARAGAPNVNRLINHCCLWAEYARRTNTGGERRWSPHLFLKDCMSAGVEFERIGLQLYYPQQDLMEIERMLDRFKDFGKRLQISELSCNSAEGTDPESMRPRSVVPGWHGPWNETKQADWLEAIYTLCYSKPEFEAVGYWDLADTGGHFWPHGGLLRKDFSPKESYGRLVRLKRSWEL